MKVVGYVDFAGSGVVHMVGGGIGLICAILIKPRDGRFDPTQQEANDFFRANYIPYVAMGSLFLFFSWFGFNCGSVFNIVSSAAVDSTYMVGLIGTNTAICAASSGLFSFMIEYFINRGSGKDYSLPALANGILGGLVAVTAGCHNYRPYGAFIIGIVASMVYTGYAKLLICLKIDDPLNAVAVHFGCGSLGVIAVGFFDINGGVLYGHGGRLLGYQFMGFACIAGWSIVFGGFIFMVLNVLGLGRIPPFEQETGLDHNCILNYGYSFDDVSSHHYGVIFYRRHYDLFNNLRQLQYRKYSNDKKSEHQKYKESEYPLKVKE